MLDRLFVDNTSSIVVGSRRYGVLTHIAFFSPVIAIAFQSYFRKELVSTFASASQSNPEYFYLSIRAFLFSVFALFIFKFKMPGILLTRTTDVYGNERSDRDPLLGLRGLACLNVFFGHWFLIAALPSYPATEAWDYYLRVALTFSPWCGVWMFFTLSGYLMTKGFVSARHRLNNEGMRRYFRNRMLRILPIYFISIAVVALLTNRQALNVFEKGHLLQILDALLFDQQGGGVIGALWSVSTEFQFYLIAPMIAILLLSLHNRQSVLIVLAVIFVISLAFPKYLILKYHPETWHNHVYMPLLANLDCFVSGAIAAVIVDKSIRNGLYLKRGVSLGIGVAIIAQAIFSLWSYPEMIAYPGTAGSSTRIYYLCIAPGTTALLTAIVIILMELSTRSGKQSRVTWTIATFFGLITYSLYVVHEPVLLEIKPLLSDRINIFYSFAIMPIALALCVGCAWLMYRFIEKPFDNLRSSSNTVARITGMSRV
jgi:peptidoglycan/LPS O-acetylase OafA/YrhL